MFDSRWYSMVTHAGVLVLTGIGAYVVLKAVAGTDGGRYPYGTTYKPQQ